MLLETERVQLRSFEEADARDVIQ